MFCIVFFVVVARNIGWKITYVSPTWYEKRIPDSITVTFQGRHMVSSINNNEVLEYTQRLVQKNEGIVLSAVLTTKLTGLNFNCRYELTVRTYWVQSDVFRSYGRV